MVDVYAVRGSESSVSDQSERAEDQTSEEGLAFIFWRNDENGGQFLKEEDVKKLDGALQKLNYTVRTVDTGNGLDEIETTLKKLAAEYCNCTCQRLLFFVIMKNSVNLPDRIRSTFMGNGNTTRIMNIPKIFLVQTYVSESEQSDIIDVNPFVSVPRLSNFIIHENQITDHAGCRSYIDIFCEVAPRGNIFETLIIMNARLCALPINQRPNYKWPRINSTLIHETSL